ncbi:hypothetical protein ACFXKJ_28230 [Kitasatospora indigofera]|uniref:hypothetical protein n=1 Tax=Kitasatospora indigofera TaxID=67307 RepID=UPI0036631089
MSGSQAAGVLAGPLFVLFALGTSLPNIEARFDFAGAHPVRATVVSADYRHSARGTRALGIVLAAPQTLVLDDLPSAPDDLDVGSTVTALTGSGRPGHAVLPSQLRWSVLAFPAFMALFGVLMTFAGVDAVRRLPRSPGGADPERWD